MDIFHFIFTLLVGAFFFFGLLRAAAGQNWVLSAFFGLLGWLFLVINHEAFGQLYVSNAYFAVLATIFMAFSVIATFYGYFRDGDEIRAARRPARNPQSRNPQPSASTRTAGPDENIERERVWETLKKRKQDAFGNMTGNPDAGAAREGWDDMR